MTATFGVKQIKQYLFKIQSLNKISEKKRVKTEKLQERREDNP